MPANTQHLHKVTSNEHDMKDEGSMVKIAIYDAKTHTMLGSDEFKNSFFHTFPDPPEITDELLGRIFGEPSGRFMK